MTNGNLNKISIYHKEPLFQPALQMHYRAKVTTQIMLKIY